MPGNISGGETPGAAVDRTLQSASPPQRLEDAVTSRILCGMDSQKQETTCPKLGGAVQFNVQSLYSAPHTAFLNRTTSIVRRAAGFVRDTASFSIVL